MSDGTLDEIERLCDAADEAEDTDDLVRLPKKIRALLSPARERWAALTGALAALAQDDALVDAAIDAAEKAGCPADVVEHLHEINNALYRRRLRRGIGQVLASVECPPDCKHTGAEHEALARDAIAKHEVEQSIGLTPAGKLITDNPDLARAAVAMGALSFVPHGPTEPAPAALSLVEARRQLAELGEGSLLLQLPRDQLAAYVDTLAKLPKNPLYDRRRAAVIAVYRAHLAWLDANIAKGRPNLNEPNKPGHEWRYDEQCMEWYQVPVKDGAK